MIEPLELQVADNGDGLSDVAKALVLFSSSKSGHGSGSLITLGVFSVQVGDSFFPHAKGKHPNRWMPVPAEDTAVDDDGGGGGSGGADDESEVRSVL